MNDQTMRDKLVSTAKYAGSSITLGMALTQIIVFTFPHVKEISEAIQALVTFGINIILVQSGVISDSE